MTNRSGNAQVPRDQCDEESDVHTLIILLPHQPTRLHCEPYAEFLHSSVDVRSTKNNTPVVSRGQRWDSLYT